MFKHLIWAFALLLALQGSVHAFSMTTDITTVTADPNSIKFKFTPANNVIIDYITVTTANPKVDYTTAAKNTNGNRIYSTSNATTSIWFQENVAWKGTALDGSSGTWDPDVTGYPTAAGESGYSGWTGL